MSKHRNVPAPSIFNRAAHLAVTASLAACMLPLTAQAARGLELDQAASSYSWSGAAPASTYSARNASLPGVFDMRGQGWVSRVKFQNPWGTCWGFAATAAAESSIMSELMANGASGQTVSLYSDLSERHLAWFTYTPIPDGTQADEGGHNAVTENNPDAPDPDHTAENAIYNVGGYPAYATSLYSSGIGPLFESQAPYRNDEGYIDPYDETHDFCYSEKGTWALANDLRFNQVIELEESYVLPVPSDYDPESQAELWTAANDAIKEQLMAGRAVSVGFQADHSAPNQKTDKGYMNPGDNDTKTWAHYTYEKAGANHAVTIVGWDDSYSRENFGNPDPKTGEVDPSTQPAGDGAWIVKNSWGDGSDFPYGYPGGWGTDEDGDGNGDGYFYLSYYDKSISMPEALNFNTENLEGHADSYIVDAYDYMPVQSTINMAPSEFAADVSAEVDPEGKIKAGNVFTAESDQVVRTLSCETSKPNTTVTYEVYRMPEDWDGDWSQAQAVLTKEMDEPYEFGGFHRVELSADEQVKVHEGQRYAVVVTMHCEDDDTDYLRADFSLNEVYRESSLGTDLRAMQEEWREEYLAEHPDATEEEVSAYLDQKLDEMDGVEKDMLEPSYFKGVVNKGESFVCYGGSWYDWATYFEDLVSPYMPQYDTDNFPVKAYAEIADFASSDSLKQLEDDVKTARNLLQQTAVSKDGSDVDPSATWVDAEAHDAFGAAIGEAEESLGAEWAAQGDIDEAAAALASAQEAFEGAMKPGTKGTGGGDEGKTPTDSKKPASKKGLPSTGDASFAAAVAALVAGGGFAGIGTAIRRRRR